MYLSRALFLPFKKWYFTYVKYVKHMFTYVPLQIAFSLNIKFLQFVGVWIHSLIFNCRVEIHYITTLKFIVLCISFPFCPFFWV